jgi:branched-chain amino acid transport system substrate-binding protein
MAALGYDAARILADSLARAGTTEGPALRDAIASTKDFAGVTGRITIDPERNAVKDAVVLKIDGGRFRYHRTVSAH